MYYNHQLSLQVQARTPLLLVMAALPSHPPRLTQTFRRTLFCQLNQTPVTFSAAAVMAAASQKAKSPAASVQPVIRESRVRRQKLEEAVRVLSWVFSASSVDWWLLLLFL